MPSRIGVGLSASAALVPEGFAIKTETAIKVRINTWPLEMRRIMSSTFTRNLPGDILDKDASLINILVRRGRIYPERLIICGYLACNKSTITKRVTASSSALLRNYFRTVVATVF
jgi:hypothetical protein